MDASQRPAGSLGQAQRILAYGPRLSVVAGLALGLTIIHIGLFGQTPTVPAAQRIADAVLCAALLALMWRLRQHFAARGAQWPLSHAEEAAVWVLAGASALAPVAGLLGLTMMAGALSLSSLSILAKLLVVYEGVKLAGRARQAALTADVVRLAVPPAAAVVLSFGAMIAVGSLLLSLPAASSDGVPVRPIDALFTATSASCVTGLIVKDTPRDWSPFGQAVILLLLQIGGLGTMTLASVLRLLAHRRSTVLQRLAIRDTVAPGAHDVLHVVKRVVQFTVICEAAGALVLWWRWVTAGTDVWKALYNGVFHSISAFCNAGFSVFSDSLEQWVADPVVNLVVGGLIIVGGIGFPVVIDLAHWLKARLGGRRLHLSLHTKLVLTTSALLLVLGFAVFLILEWDGAFAHLTPGGKCLAAAFASLTPRTAGFDTVPPARFSLASKWTTMALMFVGASPGSTGGGIKTATAGVLMIVVIGMARGRGKVRVLRRSIGESSRHRAFAVASLMAAAAFIVTFSLAVTEHSDLTTVLFESLSALGTVGLSLGLTPLLSTAGRLIVSMAMYVGRVGPLTLALAVPPARPVPVEYPEEEVMVG